MPTPTRARAHVQPPAPEDGGLADARHDPCLHRLVRLAALAVDAPVACVSLLDGTERARFAVESGRVGVMRPPPAPQGIEGLPDLFAGTDEATGCAYAGAPLVLPAGSSVGVLWALDPGPREWTEREGVLLRGLAAGAGAELAAGVHRAAGPDRTPLALALTELRAPIAAMRLQAEAVGRAAGREGPAGQGKQMADLRRIAEHLSALAGGFERWVESGELLLRPEPVDCAELLEVSRSVLSPGVAEAGARLDCRAPRRLPPLFADPTRLLQVLTKLVEVAAHQAPRGGTVEVEAEAVQEAVCFRVSASLPAGPAKERADALRAGWRGEVAGDDGEGLAIARGIVEAHGGEFRYGPAEGGLFAFTLPVGGEARVLPGVRLGSEGQEAAVAAERPEAGPARDQPPPDFRMGPGAPAPERPAAELAQEFQSRIVAAIHVGHLRAGDRLPSIRELARAVDVTPYAALQVYRELEARGLVERRERSGIYVASLESGGVPPLPETARWIAGVLSQSFEHHLKLPHLADLVRRWTATVPIRCVCVESTLDNRIALCEEVEHVFGLQSHVASIEAIPSSAEELPEELRGADLFITTAFHAAELRPLAKAHSRPLLVATVNEETARAAEHRLREGSLVVICADPRFGERVRGLRGGIYRERVRVVLADDADALATLDRSEPVLLTLAARQRIKGADFRLVAPHHPSFSLEFARKLAEMIVWLNLEADRRRAVASPDARNGA